MSNPENLGALERSVKLLTSFTDHMVHNRPGLVRPENNSLGFLWLPVRLDGDHVYFMSGSLAGHLASSGQVTQGSQVVGRYQPPGLFPEVAAFLYEEALAIYQADNHFFAQLASYSIQNPGSFSDDLKVIFAAILLVQGRHGAPVKEDGQVLFLDEDYRAVGEAMLLLPKGLNPKLVKRVGDLLRLPQIAAINHAQGFGGSDRAPATGRYPRAVTRWLLHRDRNPTLLKSAVNAGWTRTIRNLARFARYKPQSAAFFETLNWPQTQKNGHRTVGLDVRASGSGSWENLSEKEAIARIHAEKPAWKRLIGLYPRAASPAIIQAALEAGGISPKDLILMTPTLEDLGIAHREPFASRLAKALSEATDLRAANVARNVRDKTLQDQLQGAAANVMARAVEEVVRDLRIYVIVDKSGSMEGALDRAVLYLTRLLVAFPLDRLRVSVFNTVGSEIRIQSPKAAAIRNAFQGYSACGGTSYRAGVQVFSPSNKDGEDNLFLFVGDEEGEASSRLASALLPFKPVALGILPVQRRHGTTVQGAAQHLGIPCLTLDEAMFESDPYAAPRILRNLIASTPRSKAASLVDAILETTLLTPPTWAT